MNSKQRKIITESLSSLSVENLRIIAAMMKIKDMVKKMEIIELIVSFNSTLGVEKNFNQLRKYCASNNIKTKGVKRNKQDYLLLIKSKDRKFSRYEFKPLSPNKYFNFLLEQIKDQKEIVVPDTEDETEDEAEELDVETD